MRVSSYQLSEFFYLDHTKSQKKQFQPFFYPSLSEPCIFLFSLCFVESLVCIVMLSLLVIVLLASTFQLGFVLSRKKRKQICFQQPQGVKLKKKEQQQQSWGSSSKIGNSCPAAIFDLFQCQAAVKKSTAAVLREKRGKQSSLCFSVTKGAALKKKEKKKEIKNSSSSNSLVIFLQQLSHPCLLFFLASVQLVYKGQQA